MSETNWFLEFERFFRTHKNLFIHYQWPQREEQVDAIFCEWSDAFAEEHITYSQAIRASSLLYREPVAWEKHFPRLLEIARGLRDAEARQLADESRANADAGRERPDPATVAASIGCPECDGGAGPRGMARRRMAMPGFPWSPWVDLYCRCPFGRWLAARGIGTYQDLQMMQSLWDGTLDHGSWDWSDPPSPQRPPAGVRYLTPAEARDYRPPARALPPPPPCPRPIRGVPASATPAQEMFYHRIGVGYREDFEALPADRRAAVLDEFRDDFDPAKAEAIITYLRSLRPKSDQN